MSLTKCAEAHGCGATYNGMFYLMLGFLSLLILCGGYLISLTTRDMVQVTFVTGACFLFLLVFWIDKPTMYRSIVSIIFFCLITTLFSGVIVKGKLMYTNGAYEITSETKIVSPFAHEKPLEIAPPLSGMLAINNESFDWSVFVRYTLLPETRLRAEDLQSMRSLLSEGVEIPPTLLSEAENPKDAVEAYLLDEYPFLHFEVVVKKFTITTWE